MGKLNLKLPSVGDFLGKVATAGATVIGAVTGAATGVLNSPGGSTIVGGIANKYLGTNIQAPQGTAGTGALPPPPVEPTSDYISGGRTSGGSSSSDKPQNPKTTGPGYSEPIEGFMALINPYEINENGYYITDNKGYPKISWLTVAIEFFTLGLLIWGIYKLATRKKSRGGSRMMTRIRSKIRRRRK